MKETDDVEEGIKLLFAINFSLSLSMIKEEHEGVLYVRFDWYKKWYKP